jgi:hypothetical protein
MWLKDESLRTFNALTVGNKRRVCWCLARGRALDDPRKAEAAFELAEGYRRQGRLAAVFTRWFPSLFVLYATCFVISAATRGDQLIAIFAALIVPVAVAQLLVNPAAWPKNMARSLEASKPIHR